MIEPPEKQVHLGFENHTVKIPIDRLIYSQPLLPTIKKSIKYQQIKMSIKTIGLVEPLVVINHPDQSDRFLLLDGHLRAESMRDLNILEAVCLVSKDDEAYTYNKSVNRLSSIQEHRMIVQAHENGVSENTLAAALGISVHSIRERFRLLNGICDEVAVLLAEKPVPKRVFPILKCMKAFRQIDVARIMISMNNYSAKLATAMLHSTPPEQLAESYKRKSESNSALETLKQLEKELAMVQSDTKQLEESYGPDNLQLTIIKTHIKTILNNARIVNWLLKTNREYLEQLQLISEM